MKHSPSFFTTRKIDDRWHLIDPDGNPFFSLGVGSMVCQIRETQGSVVHRFGNGPGWFESWADSTLKRVLDLGFNTIGAWHEPYYWGNATPKSIELRLSKHAKKANDVWGVGFPDVFDPSFEASIHQQLVDVFYGKGSTHVEDSSLIGYFTDNELHWWGRAGEWGKDDQGMGSDSTGLVDDFISLPPTAPGKIAWVDALTQKYLAIEALNESWESEYSDFSEILQNHQYRAPSEAFRKDKQDFLEKITRTYFEKTASALKQYDANHLNLGCRLVGTSAPDTVLKVMADFVDVASINFYCMGFPHDYLDHLYEIVGKPIMITEFSFCGGKNSGFPRSTNGAQNVIVKDQTRRGQLYHEFVLEAFKKPYMVGTHWFALYDYHGDEHGLIGNYGLLDAKDHEWKEMTAWMRKTHHSIEHARKGESGS